MIILLLTIKVPPFIVRLNLKSAPPPGAFFCMFKLSISSIPHLSPHAQQTISSKFKSEVDINDVNLAFITIQKS